MNKRMIAMLIASSVMLSSAPTFIAAEGEKAADSMQVKEVKSEVATQSGITTRDALQVCFLGQTSSVLQSEKENSYLQVDTKINVKTEGTYKVSAIVSGKDDTYITNGEVDLDKVGKRPTSVKKSVKLAEGEQDLSFFFNSDKFNEVAGPYVVKMFVYDSKGKMIDKLTYDVSTYTEEDFNKNSAEFVNISDEYGEADEEDLAKTLDIDTLIDIKEAAQYTISATLYKGEEEITTTEEQVDYTTGLQEHKVKFSGKDINLKKLDGPYDVVLNITQGTKTVTTQYVTSEYGYAAFVTSGIKTNDIKFNAYDTNANGKYEKLVTNGTISAKESGNYLVDIELLTEAGQFIASDSTQVEVNAGKDTDFELMVKGQDIYKSREKAFVAKIKVYDIEGELLKETDETIGQYTYDDFEIPDAIFTNGVTTTIKDTNNDGVYDYLVATVKVDAEVAGTYTITGLLTGNNFENIAFCDKTVTLKKGSNTVELQFNGKDIIKSGINGPYLISGLTIAKESENIDRLYSPYKTGAYSYLDFQSSDIVIFNKSTDKGMDTNNNGKYDNLTFSTTAYIPQAGKYEYNARIIDKEGREICWASNTQTLGKGLQNITLAFNGKSIYGNGQNGPYTVKDLSINQGSTSCSTTNTYKTSPYKFEDFEACSTIKGVVMNGSKPVANATIMLNSREGAATSSDGSFVVKIMNPGVNTIKVISTELNSWNIYVNGTKTGKGNTASYNFGQNTEIVQIDFKTNSAPVLKPVENQSIKLGETVNFKLSATDSDNDKLTYSSSNLPKGATLNPTTGEFTWTPTAEQKGEHKDIVLSVSDGKETVSQKVSITIENSVPILQPIEDQVVKAGKTLSFKVDATDEDKDTLTYSGVNLPEGATLNAETGEFTWTPTYAQKGEYNDIVISVSDGQETVSQKVNIAVVNLVPVLQPIENQSVKAGQTLNFQVNAADEDEDTLTYSATNLPEGATLNTQTGEFTWTPTYAQKGEYKDIVISVSDGQETVSQKVNITVENLVPVLKPIKDQIVKAGKTLTFQVEATDEDGDTLTYSATNLPEGAVLDATTGKFTWTPVYEQEAEYDDITISVSDGEATVSQKVKITVDTPMQLKVEAMSTSTQQSANTIATGFRLTNVGPVDININDIVAKYFYTSETRVKQNFWCDWSNVGSSNVVGKVVVMDEPKEGADSYIELSFNVAKNKSTLAPGQTIVVQTRVARDNWTNYNQGNDYSYANPGYNYVENEQIPAYISGKLNCGVEPSKLAAPLTKELTVKGFNQNKADTTNTIQPQFYIVNTGTDVIPYKDIKVRYYYTADEVESQDFWCDWTNVGNKLHAEIVAMETPVDGADHYIELSFADADEVLGQGEAIDVRARITNANWANSSQSNDYSFDGKATNLTENKNITAYIGDKLNWGNEPTQE